MIKASRMTVEYMISTRNFRFDIKLSDVEPVIEIFINIPVIQFSTSILIM
jgi:hypothetical protein